MELLAALDEVGAPVHEEFIWLHFVDNLLPGYEFIKNNLQGSKEPRTRIALEVHCKPGTMYNRAGKRGLRFRILYGGFAAVEVVEEVAKGEMNSSGRSEGLSPQAEIT